MNFKIYCKMEESCDDRGWTTFYGADPCDNEYIAVGERTGLFSIRDTYIGRWRLPVFKGSTINEAMLRAIIAGPGPLADPDNDHPDFTAKIQYELSDDAASLRFGVYRTWSTATIDWIMNESTGFGYFKSVNSPSIKTFVQELVNRPGWRYNNHICINIDNGDASNERWEFCTYDFGNIPGFYACQLYIDFDVPGQRISESSALSDSTSPTEISYPADKFYIDTIEMHPEIYESAISDDYIEDIRTRILPDTFTLEERVPFELASKLLDLSGKNVPIWYYGTSYNTVVSNVSLEYGATMMLATIECTNTRKRRSL